MMNSKIEGVSGRVVFPIKVIDVNGERAVIKTDNGCLEVTSQVPLDPGQELLVRALGTPEGKEEWQIICDLTEASTPSLFSKLGLSEDTANRAIASALRRAGLPITRENICLIRLLIEHLGTSTYHDLYTAIASIITSLRLAIPWNFLFPLLKPFIDRVVLAQETSKRSDRDCGEGANKTERNAAHQLRKSLSLLQKAISCLATRLGNSSLKDIDWEEEQRLLLGGQLLAWGQGEDIRRQGVYFYLPLFLTSRDEEYPSGEMLVFPKSKGGLISVVLNLMTRHLGWIRVELGLDGDTLSVKMLAEELSTKELIDASWPELAEALRKGTSYAVVWSGCRVGSVKSFLRELTEGYTNPRFPEALDLKI